MLKKGLVITLLLLFTISPCLSAQSTPDETIARMELEIQKRQNEIIQLNDKLLLKDQWLSIKDEQIKALRDELFWDRIQTISAFVAIVIWGISNGR